MLELQASGYSAIYDQIAMKILGNKDRKRIKKKYKTATKNLILDHSNLPFMIFSNLRGIKKYRNLMAHLQNVIRE